MSTSVLRLSLPFCPVLALSIAALVGLSQPPASPPQPTLAAGIARLQASDYAAAARILEQVTRREPRNGRAWRNLALAYQKLKQFDLAIAAYLHALQVDPAVPTPLFNIGTLYALKG